MAASRNDIRGWSEEGKMMNHPYMLVVTDTYDWSDFPVYVRSFESVHDVLDRENRIEMQVVQELYNLSMDIEQQMSQFRAFNF